jgi:hypothetical protein
MNITKKIPFCKNKFLEIVFELGDMSSYIFSIDLSGVRKTSHINTLIAKK